MFCHNCGKQLPEGTLFCDNCGAQQQEAPVQENVIEQPVETQVLNEQAPESVVDYGQTTVLSPEDMPAFDIQPQAVPVVENIPEQQYVPEQQYGYAPDFAAPAFEEPKKKKKIWGKLIPAVIALGLVAAIVLNLGTVIGFGIKTFGSDKAYFGYVEKKAFEGYADDISNVYGSVVEALEFDSAAEGELRLVLGDELLQMAETALGGQMQLDWVKDIAIAYDMNTDGSAEEFSLGLKLGKTEILALNMIMDMVKGDIYMALANLSDKYLYINGGSAVVGGASGSSILGSIYGNENLTKALPDEETVNELIDKYVEIVLDQLENVEKSSDSVKVDGIEQDCTKIKFTVTQEDFMNIALALLEEVKNDGEIEDIIKDFVKFLNDEELLDQDPSKVYSELVSGIEDTIKEGKEAKASMDSESLKRELMSITDYVNGSHEIIGRDLEVAGQKYVSYATAHDGSDFATEVNIANMLTFKGNGTDKSDKISGKFNLTVSGMNIADVEVTDFDTAALDDQILNGTFRVLINKQLLSGIDAGDYAALLSGFDGIEIKSAGDKDEASVEFNVIYNNKTLVGIATDAKKVDSEKIAAPDKKDTIDATDSEAVKAYLESLDLDKLYTALKDAGVPSQLVDLLKSALDSGLSGIGGSSVTDFAEPY